MLCENDEQIQERIARQNEDRWKFLVKMYKVLGAFLIGVIIVDAIFFQLKTGTDTMFSNVR